MRIKNYWNLSETDDQVKNISLKMVELNSSENNSTDNNIGTLNGILMGILVLISIYFLIPFVFRFSVTFQRHVIFMHLFSFTRHIKNFYNPKVHGVQGGRNFYLCSTNQNTRIGLWHILPKSLTLMSKDEPPEYWEDTLKNSGKSIILYFHGNMGTRATSHRRELYTIFQEQDCHVIVFDYRGFADSSSIQPSESVVVEDGLTVYNWLRKTLGNNSTTPIFFWGHSLGTGVSSHLASKLSLETENSLAGLILESPFTNMREEVKSIYLTTIFRCLPWFDWCFGSQLTNNDFAFENDIHIRNIEIPILILHVINDIVVPYRLGRKLHEIGLKYRSNKAKPIYFKKFSGYSISDSHVFICREPKLPVIITQFMESCIKNDWPCLF